MKKINWNVVMAGIGFAIGLGNFWLFPYVIMNYGDSALFIFYILVAFAIATPIIALELVLGRTYRGGPLKAISEHFTKNRGFGAIFAVMCTFFAGTYAVSTGWSLYFAIESITNENLAQYKNIWESLYSSFSEQLIATLLVLALTYIIMINLPSREKLVSWYKYFVSAIFFLLVIDTALVLSIPNALGGLYNYLILIDFSKVFNGISIANVVIQALYSTSAAIGGFILLGSLLRKEEDIAKSSILMVAGDTLVAIFGAIIVIAIVASLVPNPTEYVLESGSALTFKTIPEAVQAMAGSNYIIARLFSISYYGMLLLGAWTTLIILIEVGVEAIETIVWNRKKAIDIIMMFTVLVGSASSYNKEIIGKITVLTFFENSWSVVGLFIAGILICSTLYFKSHKLLGRLPFIYEKLAKYFCPAVFIGFAIWWIKVDNFGFILALLLPLITLLLLFGFREKIEQKRLEFYKRVAPRPVVISMDQKEIKKRVEQVESNFNLDKIKESY
ncbi:MAG: sodium-dependent transporter, partial [Methanosarcinales archaeon]